YNYSRGANSPGAQVIQILVCPSDNMPNPPVGQYTVASGADAGDYFFGLSSYAGCAGSHSCYWPSAVTQDGIFNINSRIRIAEITDGTSNTIMFGERSHFDPNYGLLTPAGTNLNTWGGWAWANTSAIEDETLSADGTLPINWRIPPGMTDNTNYVLS